ncbi:hydrogenase 4 subunit B [Propionivibrio limicola]|uniref:hydrogenase 4 subunit B n=1 Tax=Propionivibrio limicola TaxID=167645 RepID=UPI0012915BB4|nr:hydrogenase 4 subunit B [Propionivibrio limicola]
MREWQEIHWILLLVLGWIGLGVTGLFAARWFTFVTRVLFPLGAANGLLLALLALTGMMTGPQEAILPFGLPDLPFHVRLDALSAFFLLILGAATAGVSIYASGYFRREQGASPGLHCLLYHVFLAGMAFVMLANDAYAFMVAWETMALASYFLVISEHRHAEIRRAGYLFLLIAHVGSVGILLSFGVMAGSTGDYTFDAMRAFDGGTFWATAAFLLALFGFGAKAGLLPLHAGLPGADVAAPSPVAALMSGVMVKTAIYGTLRISFDLLGTRLWWWGVLVIALGLITALFGVIFAAVQSDMKRLLAYSSIENIGLIYAGIGLTLVFHAFAMSNFAALALTATLYHCINHAFFKTLLFLCTGSVLHATGERNLGKLGGLIRHMPWVSWLALIGILGAAGLPPLNGFVSEWLLLQGFLFTPGLPHGYLNMLLPIAAATIALTAALAGYTMVKFFGVTFLGQPREERLSQARDVSRLKRIGLLWLASGCVLLGLLPNIVISLLEPVTSLLVSQGRQLNAGMENWWLLAPISEDRASYSPAIFFGGILLLIGAAYLCIKHAFPAATTRGPAWDCGFPMQDGRMQDTAEGFSQPIRRIFSPFFRRTCELPSPFDRQPHYRNIVEDPFWYWLYLPIARLVDLVSRFVAFLQHGRIAVYLMYSFITLLTLLVLTR